MSRSTIFALSSGAPPAGIAVVRVSGPAAADALRQLCSTGAEAVAPSLPTPRRATLRTLYDAQGHVLDRALVLWMPGPGTATGEDMVELHLHGGRAVVAAVLAALAAIPGFVPAAPGEFTRRAHASGVLDLIEAEALADLLAAETESQRRQAMMQGHVVSQQVRSWRERLLVLGAAVEAALDFADEDDVDAEAMDDVVHGAGALRADIDAWRQRPSAERLRDGFRVVIAGPPNAGKSSLINAIAGRSVAITSDIAGTTRDIIEAPLAIYGIPMVFSDTAGLREETNDVIEGLGIDRSREAIERADIVLWLGPGEQAPEHPNRVLVGSKADMNPDARGDVVVSAVTGEGLDALLRHVSDIARTLLPVEGEAAVTARVRDALDDVSAILSAIDHDRAIASDPILLAETLRQARVRFDALLGQSGVEDMLDALFGRFCIGK